MKTTNKKNKVMVEESFVVEPEGILAEEEIKNLKEEEIIAVKPKKKKYKIILATKNYYIINKDGNNIFVNEKNEYSKGDEIFY